MSVLLEDFMPLIRPHALNCSPPVIEGAVVEVAIDFCEATKVWRHKANFVSDMIEPGLVMLAAPAGAKLYEVERVWFEGRKLDKATIADLPPEIYDGSPQQYTQIQREQITVWPCSLGTTFAVSMIIKPSRAAQELPDFLLEDYGDAIADGVIAKLLLMPERPWSQPQLGAYHKGLFEDAKNKAFATNTFGQHRARARTKASFI